MKTLNRKPENDFKSREPDDPRGLKELQEAEELLFLQVWFNRNKKALFSDQNGKIVIAEDGTRPIASGVLPPTQQHLMEQALLTARDAVKRYGKENFGPWDDMSGA